MKLKILILLSLVMMAGCTQESKSREILENNGYESIQMTGYHRDGCSRDDISRDGFRAKKNGKIIVGTVCAQLGFTAVTIRFN